MAANSAGRRRTSYALAWEDRRAELPEALVEAMRTLRDALREPKIVTGLDGEYPEEPPDPQLLYAWAIHDRCTAIAEVRDLLNAATVQAAIDARNAGLSLRETARALNSDHSAVRQWLEAAANE